MKKVMISDISLSEASKKNGALSFKEKLEIAKKLNDLKVDAIEVGPLLNEKTDAVLIRTISTFVKNSTIAVLCEPKVESIKKAYDAVATAKSKRLVINIPVSSVQMEYTYQKKPKKMLELIEETVKYAKTLCNDVEVSLDDATRSDIEFLSLAIDTAVNAGANIITLADLSGTMLPNDFGAFITDIKQNAPMLSKVVLGVQTNNSLTFAVANLFSAIKVGASLIKTSSISNNFASLEKTVAGFVSLGNDLEVKCGINYTEIGRIISQISRITTSQGEFLKTVSDEDDKEVFKKETTLAELTKIIKKKGYVLTADDIHKVYERFIAFSNKKEVGSKELDVIIANTALQVPDTYSLKSYVINSGNIISSTANIILEKEGELFEGLSSGNGPIDASFKAIENILGHHYELDDFQIQSVTEGKEAMGEALVKLRVNGKLYSGRGVSIDIIGASIRAYLNAINKIIHEEND
ncbi:MAG: hypothetical protein E7342_02835 [Clostridiales bacterium]|nr:hypothetical protein [Clostridiales bacterium]